MKILLFISMPSVVHTEYVTPNEAAQLFNVDIKTIRNWSRRGKLKFYKYGTIIFFKLHELIQVITQ